MNRQIAIGYWRHKDDNEGAWPEPYTERKDQDEIVDRLKAAMVTGFLVSYRGSSNCRLCGKLNGWHELEIIRGSTKWIIPEGYVHYLEDHRVGYDPELIEALDAFVTAREAS